MDRASRVSTPDTPRESRSASPAIWYSLAAVLLVLDQLSKWLALGELAAGRAVEVTGFFNLILAFNRGAAFSFLADAPGWQGPAFAAFAIIAAAVISVLLWREPHKRLFCAGLALILGGAVGNLIDRLRFGHVVDFIDLHAWGWHWPTFNLADSGITVGAALLIVDSFIDRRNPR